MRDNPGMRGCDKQVSDLTDLRFPFLGKPIAALLSFLFQSFQRFAILVGILIAGPVGCGFDTILSEKPRFSLQSIVLQASEEVNDNTPLAVDLVILFDEALAPQIAALPARDWFSQSEQFQRDFPREIKVKRWEIIPGQIIGPISLDSAFLTQENGRAAAGAFVFADFLSPGNHRARLVSQEGVRVLLGRDEMLLQGFDINS